MHQPSIPGTPPTRRSLTPLAVVGAVPVLGVLLVAVGALAPAGAAPEPAAVPQRWQLEVDPGPLRVAVVETPEGGPRPYLYLTYTVTNNTGEDLVFAPVWDLGTDRGDLFRGGRDVPFAVTRELIQRLENPLLESQTQILGPLLQGPENARTGLVIWPAPSVQIDEIRVYGAGFSGETVTLQIPDPEGEGDKRVVLRKTLMLRYDVRGELDVSRTAPIERAGTARGEWIMR